MHSRVEVILASRRLRRLSAAARNRPHLTFREFHHNTFTPPPTNHNPSLIVFPLWLRPRGAERNGYPCKVGKHHQSESLRRHNNLRKSMTLLLQLISSLRMSSSMAT